jgi:hypothetical protein
MDLQTLVSAVSLVAVVGGGRLWWIRRAGVRILCGRECLKLSPAGRGLRVPIQIVLQSEQSMMMRQMRGKSFARS